MSSRSAAIAAIFLTGWFAASAPAGGQTTLPATTRSSATPKEAVVSLFRAMRDGNADAAMALVKGDDAPRRAVGDMVRVARATEDFRAAFVKAYGEKAWHDFNDPKHDPNPKDAKFTSNATLTLIEEADINRIGDSEIEAKEGEASFPIPNAERKGRAIKVGDSWFVDAASLFPPGTDPKEFGEMMCGLAERIP